VLDGDEVGVRAERALRREPQHPRPERREEAPDRHGRFRAHRGAIHRVEVAGHPLDGPRPRLSPPVGRDLMPDPEAEDDALAEGVRERSRAAGHRLRVPRRDVGDPRAHREPVGGGQQQREVREDLARPTALGHPYGREPDRLDLPHRRADPARRHRVERERPHAHPPEPGAHRVVLRSHARGSLPGPGPGAA
jgi:hypothetical protein